MEAETVRALGALRSLWSNKKLPAEKRQETHFLSNEDTEKSIEHYVERETAGVRKQVEDAEAVIRQEEEAKEAARNVGLTTTEAKLTFHEMMVAIGDCPCDIASSADGDDGDDEDDEETEQGQLSEHNEPCWVMGTITKRGQQRMKRFRQKQMKLDQLTQMGSWDAANYFRQRDKKYGKCE